MKSRAKNRAKKNKKQPAKVGAQRAASSQTKTPVGQRLSLCMIVKNEADNLAQCLSSIQAAVDEIIVVDTGSTDATPAIAKQYGAKVVRYSWQQDFSAARNESIKHATGDYIIWLDGDDVVATDEVKKIQALKKSLTAKKDQAYFVVVQSEDRTVGVTEFHQCRIFPNCAAARFEYPIHEQISHKLDQAGIQLLSTDIAVRHVGNIDREALTAKTKRNLAIIDKELKKDPESVVMNFHAARSYANLEDYQQAVDHMQKILDNLSRQQDKGALYAEAGLLTARYYNEMRLYSSAESVLNELKPSFPEIGLIDFELGKSYLLAERYPEAVESLRESLSKKLNPEFMPINFRLVKFQNYFFLGKAYEALDEPAQAVKMYQESLTYHQWDHKSFHALAMLHLKAGDYQAALEELLQASDSAPEEDCVLQSNLGLIYRKLKNYREAEQALMRAVEINPDRMEAFVNLGYLHMETGNYDKAAGSFVRALRLENDLWDVRLSLCEAYFRTGQVEKLVATCSLILQALDLTVNQTLNGIEDLAALFELIGDNYFKHKQTELAVMAYQTGFVIYPLTSILYKLLPVATESKRQVVVMDSIKETMSRYGQDEQVMASIQGVLDQFKHTAQYAYK